MSKRITINISNDNRPDLNSLFHQSLIRKDVESSVKSVEPNYDEFDFWDDETYMHGYFSRMFPELRWDDDDDELPDFVYPSDDGEKKNHKLYIDDDLDDAYSTEYKEIWFYHDYHSKYERKEFRTLKEFEDFCDDMNFVISDETANSLVYNYESHCCLNPESLKSGLQELVCSRSYGDMFYNVCDDNELSDA